LDQGIEFGVCLGLEQRQFGSRQRNRLVPPCMGFGIGLRLGSLMQRLLLLLFRQRVGAGLRVATSHLLSRFPRFQLSELVVQRFLGSVYRLRVREVRVRIPFGAEPLGGGNGPLVLLPVGGPLPVVNALSIGQLRKVRAVGGIPGRSGERCLSVVPFHLRRRDPRRVVDSTI
jgi:hypothetical protein